MSSSILVITLALHSVFSVHVTKDYTEVKESCIVERTGLSPLTLDGTCSDWIQAVIEDHVRNYPDLPYNIVVNGNNLSEI